MTVTSNTGRLALVLTAIITLSALVAGFVIVAGSDPRTVGVVVALVAPTVTSLVALLRAEQTAEQQLGETRKVSRAVNGELDDRIEQAVSRALRDSEWHGRKT